MFSGEAELGADELFDPFVAHETQRGRLRLTLHFEAEREERTAARLEGDPLGELDERDGFVLDALREPLRRLLEQVLSEGRLLARVHHPNVATVYAATRLVGQACVRSAMSAS